MNTRKITVLVGERLFSLFERYCEERGHKKSTLVAKLIKDHLAVESFTFQDESSPRLERGKKLRHRSANSKP